MYLTSNASDFRGGYFDFYWCIRPEPSLEFIGFSANTQIMRPYTGSKAVVYAAGLDHRATSGCILTGTFKQNSPLKINGDFCLKTGDTIQCYLLKSTCDFIMSLTVFAVLQVPFLETM